MVSQEHMEELYGPLAWYSEHQPGNRIRYLHEGLPSAGNVVWVCAARPEADPPLHLCYVVENDARGGFPDIVFPSDILAAQ